MEAMTGVQGFSNAAVGCLPYGSGNDFLRTYGTRAEFTDLDAQLAGGEVTIDLLETSLGLSATICAAGLDAQVAYGIPKFRRIPLCGGEVSYLLSIVEQLCGHIDDSFAVLDQMAAWNDADPGCFIPSVMSQYTPFYKAAEHGIGRRITTYEYRRVVNYAMDKGLAQGYMQQKSSAKEEYTPSFDLTGV